MDEIIYITSEGRIEEITLREAFNKEEEQTYIYEGGEETFTISTPSFK